MHELREIEALRLVTTGAIELPEELERDIQLLNFGDDLHAKLGLDASATAADARTAAISRAGDWASYASHGRRHPDERELTRVLRASYAILARTAQEMTCKDTTAGSAS